MVLARLGEADPSRAADRTATFAVSKEGLAPQDTQSEKGEKGRSLGKGRVEASGSGPGWAVCKVCFGIAGLWKLLFMTMATQELTSRSLPASSARGAFLDQTPNICMPKRASVRQCTQGIVRASSNAFLLQ